MSLGAKFLLKGISEKMLWRNEETGASIALIKFDKGAGIPQPHYHASNQFMFCLKGKYEYSSTGVVLDAWLLLLQSEGQCSRPCDGARRDDGRRDLRRPPLSA